MENTAKEETRHLGPLYFKAECVRLCNNVLSPPCLLAHAPTLRFELDYALACLKKPYVAICDGITSAFDPNEK